jgi:hypothetical protein
MSPPSPAIIIKNFDTVLRTLSWVLFAVASILGECLR